jgi:surfeit locus 1 family protein
VNAADGGALPVEKDAEGTKRPVFVRAVALIALAVVVAGLTGLGVWQLQRRVWKLDLIARVEQRVHAAPVPAPGPAAWPRLTADSAEYRAVRLTGRFLAARQTYVEAVTDYGSGYWVLSPFRTDRGFVVLVNRGFVPSEWRQSAASRTGPPAGEGTVTGLLRISEPGGAFLHDNQPAAGRWYSRDVAAIAASRHLTNVAPYFVDAAQSNGNGWPRGGLTVIAFPNNHLVYAITWFGLALLVAGMALRAFRAAKPPRR